MEKVKPGPVEGEDLNHLFNTYRHLVDALESGSLSLEDSIKTYEEAIVVEKRIRAVLNDADRKVVELAREDGNTDPFYSDE